MRRRRPWVRSKLAVSLDGRTALANGQSQWLTGAAARRDVHAWRARSSAVMTGVGTVLADDPRLTARGDAAGIRLLQPKRVILDSRLRTPPTAKVFGADGEAGEGGEGSDGRDAGDGGAAGEVIIFSGAAAVRRRHALERAGARIETVAADPRCDLAAVLARLAALEINTVWVEAGPTLSGALVAAGLADELVIYLAPCLLGHSARGLFELPVLTSLDQRYGLDIDDVARIGEDLRIVARPRGR
jgi:diaminohydroxyphosphoribosylaminopyrimidine deaminase/5-amino-6-(5-phosphoribosylamino)uracil reductase